MILNPAGEPVAPQTTALKACPFCGEPGSIYPQRDSEYEAHLWYQCMKCGCTGGHDGGEGVSRTRSQERWNTRADEALQRKKTLEEVLQFLDMHTPGEGTVTNPIRLSFKVLRTELLKLTACKSMDEYLSKE